MAGDRGASETLGAILMTVVAVTAVSVAAGTVFLADAPTDQPQAKITASYDGTNLTVEHRAGEALSTHESEIVLAGTGVRLDPANATELHGDGDGAFEPGEAWRFALANGTKPGRVSLVYDRQQRVLVDSAVASEPGTPTVTATTPTSEGETTTEREETTTDEESTTTNDEGKPGEEDGNEGGQDQNNGDGNGKGDGNDNGSGNPNDNGNGNGNDDHNGNEKGN